MNKEEVVKITKEDVEEARADNCECDSDSMCSACSMAGDLNRILDKKEIK